MYIKCHCFSTHFNHKLLFRMAWDVGCYRRDFCTIISTPEQMQQAGKRKKKKPAGVRWGERESESEKEKCSSG